MKAYVIALGVTCLLPALSSLSPTASEVSMEGSSDREVLSPLAIQAAPTTVTGTTTSLSISQVRAAAATEQGTIYAWSRATGPGEVTFSPNGTHGSAASVATFTAAGDYTLRVTLMDDAGNRTATGTVDVTVNAVESRLQVHPERFTLGFGESQALKATALDQFGQPLDSAPALTWSMSGSAAAGASLDDEGLLTAGPSTQGTLSVRVLDGALTATAEAQVQAVPTGLPSVVTAAEAASAHVTSASTALAVEAHPAHEGMSLSYVWEKASGPGTVHFSRNGTGDAHHATATFSAPGLYALRVTASDAHGRAVASTVDMSVLPKPVAVHVKPVLLAMVPGQAERFRAVVTNQFGEEMESDDAVQWSSSESTDVRASGTFRPLPSFTGRATVTASVGTLSGKATVQVGGAMLLSPQPGTVVRDHTQVRAGVGDPSGIAQVTLLVDGKEAKQVDAVSSPLVLPLSTRSLPNGAHSLALKVLTRSGRILHTESTPILVQNAESLSTLLGCQSAALIQPVMLVVFAFALILRRRSRAVPKDLDIDVTDFDKAPFEVVQ